MGNDSTSNNGKRYLVYGIEKKIGEIGVPGVLAEILDCLEKDSGVNNIVEEYKKKGGQK